MEDRPETGSIASGCVIRRLKTLKGVGFDSWGCSHVAATSQGFVFLCRLLLLLPFLFSASRALLFSSLYYQHTLSFLHTSQLNHRSNIAGGLITKQLRRENRDNVSDVRQAPTRPAQSHLKESILTNSSTSPPQRHMTQREYFAPRPVSNYTGSSRHSGRASYRSSYSRSSRSSAPSKEYFYKTSKSYIR